MPDLQDYLTVKENPNVSGGNPTETTQDNTAVAPQLSIDWDHAKIPAPKQEETPMQTAQPVQQQPAPQAPSSVATGIDWASTGIEPAQTQQPQIQPNTPAEVTPDVLKNDPSFMGQLKTYHDDIVGKPLGSTDEYMDWFTSSNRWQDDNSLAAAYQLARMKGVLGAPEISDDDLQRFGYLRSAWEQLPGAFTNIKDLNLVEGAGQLAANIWRGALDPVSYVGGLVGGKVVGKLVSEEAMTTALKLGSAAATDAAAQGAVNIQQQEINKAAHIQTDIDPWQALVAGSIGAAVSLPGNWLAFKPAGEAPLPFSNPKLAYEQTIAGFGNLPNDAVSQINSKTMLPKEIADAFKEQDAANSSAINKYIDSKKDSDSTFSGTLYTLHGTSSWPPPPDTGLQGFIKPSEVNPETRYDGGGGAYGNYTYFDEKGNWNDGSMSRGIDNRGGVYKVKLDFDKAFVLTPDTIGKARTILGLTDKDPAISGNDLAKGLDAKGYDGVIVRGFTDFASQLNDEATHFRITGPGEESPAIPRGKYPAADAIHDAELQQDVNEGRDWNKEDIGKNLEPWQVFNNEISHRGLTPDAAQDQIVSFKPQNNATVVPHSEAPTGTISPAQGSSIDVNSPTVTQKIQNNPTAVQFLLDQLPTTTPTGKFANIVHEVVPSNPSLENFTQDTQAQIAQALEHHPEIGTHEAITNAETLAGAKQLVGKTTPDQLEAGIAATPEGLVPGAKLVVAQGINVANRIDAALADETGASDGKMLSAIKQYYDTGTQLGQALQARQVATPVSRFMKTSGEWVQSVIGSVTDKDQQAALAKAVDKGDLSISPNDPLAAQKTALGDFAQVVKMFDPKDPDYANKVSLFALNLERNKASTFSQKFYESWFNWGLLSGPPTFTITALSHALLNIQDVYEKTAAGAADAMFNKSQNGGLTPVAALLQGYKASAGEALKVGWNTFTTEVPYDKSNTGMLVKHAMPSYIWDNNPSSDFFGTFRQAGIGEKNTFNIGGKEVNLPALGGQQLRYPGQLLSSQHDWMKAWTTRATLYQQAALEATSGKNLITGETIAGGAITDEAKLADYIHNYVTNPTAEAQEMALAHSRIVNLADPADPISQWVIDGANKIPGGRLILPFIKIGSQLMRRANDMVGIGEYTLSQRTKDDLAAGGLRANAAYARQALGTGLLAAGWMAAASGRINGAEPTDPGERAQWDADHRMPWSVRAGNQWIQFNRLDPYALPLVVGSGLENITRAWQNEGRYGIASNASMEVLKSFLTDGLLDKFYLQGIKNVVDGIYEPDKKLQAMGAGIVKSFVPSLAATAGRAFDPRQTAPMNFWEAIQDRVGFDERRQVPTKLDELGHEMVYSVAGTNSPAPNTTGQLPNGAPQYAPNSNPDTGGALSTLNRWINPFKASAITNDPVAKELFNLNIGLTATPKTWKGIDLNDQQFYMYKKFKGSQTYDGINYLINTPEWARLTQEQESKSQAIREQALSEKRQAIANIKTYAKAAADRALIGVYPELRPGLWEERLNKREKLSAPTQDQIENQDRFNPQR